MRWAFSRIRPASPEKSVRVPSVSVEPRAMRHIHAHRDAAGDLGRREHGAVAIDIGEDNLAAVVGQAIGDGLADAAGGAGDEADFAFEIALHGDLSFLVSGEW